jgi:hypothetical protein
MADNPMPDQDVKLGTAADEPAAPAVDPKTDMTRYYYRPGTTEPELRPEIAEAEARTAESAEAPADEPKPLRGKLPEDFPGHSSLEDAGLTTYAKVRAHLDKFETEEGKVEGIGPATLEKIREAMGESSPDEEEAE